MACVTTILLIIHALFAMNNAYSNTYEMLNDSYWRSTSDFKPIPSSSYGSIQLLQSLRMEFKLIFYNRNDYTNWQNIFRIGFESKNNSCYGYGSRYPSLWLTPGSDHLNLGLSQQDNCHYGPWSNFPIEKNKIYSIIIQFNDTWVYMKINDTIHINGPRQPTLNTIHNQYLNIWISTDTTSDVPQDINIILSDIIIHTWDKKTNIPTITPTVNPSQYTYNPTIAPTTYPTAPTLMAGIISTISTYLPEQNRTETDVMPSLLMDSDETYLNQIKNNGKPINITKENLFFLVSGVLLTTFVCLCMIIVVLCCHCCPKKQKKNNKNVKYHIPKSVVRKSVVHKQYKMDKNSISLVSYQEKVKQYDINNQQIINNNNNDINNNHFNIVINEEGALDLDENNEIIHIEGYDRFDGNNNTISSQENFNHALNDANAINDIMLNDVIHEIETDGNHQ